MGWVSEKIETQDEYKYFDLEVSSHTVYIELHDPIIDGGSSIAVMTPLQARRFRDQINTALYTIGED